MIANGLTWVFLAMVICAVLGLVVTTLMPSKKCEHAVHASEALEAVA